LRRGIRKVEVQPAPRMRRSTCCIFGGVVVGLMVFGRRKRWEDSMELQWINGCWIFHCVIIDRVRAGGDRMRML
jgi:hypothetical protein